LVWLYTTTNYRKDILQKRYGFLQEVFCVSV